MTRVDNVPLLYRPFFLLYGWGLGILLYAEILLLHFTCRLRFKGTDLNSHPRYILCIWHHSLVPLFTVFINMGNQVWMNHPAWYMKPIHVLLKLTRVEHICLGSSGNSGKEALENVIAYLNQGFSTTVACDGPAGPPQQLRPGVLWMSRDSGIPIIPFRFTCKPCFRLGGWDRKFMPPPFSEIIVEAGPPIIVSEANLDESRGAIVRWLNFEEA